MTKANMSTDKQTINRIIDRYANAYAHVEQEIVHAAANTLLGQALDHIRDNRGYTDRTGLLRDSRGGAVYYNGEEVAKQVISGAESSDSAADKAIASVEIPQTGVAMVLVVGADYGVWVEAKGYNVLGITAKTLQQWWAELVRDKCKERGLYHDK